MTKNRLTTNWHLRKRMAEREMFSTTDLVKPLADRGVVLSREQVYRLVTQTPQRLNLDVFAAVCDILGCEPNDLLEVTTEVADRKKTAGGSGGRPAGPKPVRARIRRP